MARTKSSPAAGATWSGPTGLSWFGLATAALSFALGLVAPTLPARANPILLVEAETGRVLEQKEPGRPWYPASVTKLMTVYVALNAVKNGRLTMDTPLTVSALAASQQPSKMGFKPGTVVTLDNAIKMVLVKSANDMAMVVAEGVGGSLPAFVAEMNATAAHLGMTGTHFENPNGLPDPDQMTTARDLAILARAIIYHFPEQEALFRIPAIRVGKAVLRNYNRLIDRYPGADGMKTGFICGSGYNLVATATRGNKRLIVVILGARSGTARTEQAALMLEKGFQSSWGVFGATQPLLSSLSNTGGPPGDMKAEVCGGKRVASEADEEPDPNASVGFAFAAPTLPKSGAELLQTLPPSMPPVQVFVGTRSNPQDLGSAYAEDDKPKKKPGTKQAAKDAKPAGGAAASSESGDTPKQAARPKPRSEPRQADAKSDAKSSDAKSSDSKSSDSRSGTATAAASKPKSSGGASSGGSSSGEGATADAGSAPKKQVKPTAPVTAGTVPSPKPKPKPKPADAPADSTAPAPKPAT